MSNQTISDMDVLVLAPFGKDSVLIENVLQESGVQVRVANTALDLVAVIPDRAGAAIVAEEALAEEHMPELARKLEAQPTWSDFPMIVLTVVA